MPKLQVWQIPLLCFVLFCWQKSQCLVMQLAERVCTYLAGGWCDERLRGQWYFSTMQLWGEHRESYCITTNVLTGCRTSHRVNWRHVFCTRSGGVWQGTKLGTRGVTASPPLLKGNKEKKSTDFTNTMTTKHMTQTPVSCVWKVPVNSQGGELPHHWVLLGMAWTVSSRRLQQSAVVLYALHMKMGIYSIHGQTPETQRERYIYICIDIVDTAS